MDSRIPFLIVSGERHLAPGERRLQLLEVPVDHALVDVLDLFLQNEINRSCQLADFRQRGGLSFVFSVILHQEQHNLNESRAGAELKISYLLWCAVCTTSSTHVSRSAHTSEWCRRLLAKIANSDTKYLDGNCVRPLSKHCRYDLFADHCHS